MKFGRLKGNGVLIQIHYYEHRQNLGEFLREGSENNVFAIYNNICFFLITFNLKVRIRSYLFWDDP